MKEFTFYVVSPRGYHDEEVNVTVPSNGVAADNAHDFERDMVAYLKKWYDVRTVLTQDEEDERLKLQRQAEAKAEETE